MKKLQLTLAFFILLVQSYGQSSNVIKSYIEQFKGIAMEEMQRTGVPASITLAQGIHETSAGQSELVQKSNNHFGIKCKTEWQGPSVSHDDDARGECFRKYTSPFDSYKDHSDFLLTRAHYAFLFKLDPTDYEAWAYGLKKAGYATNPKYPQILIKLIEDYKLQDYTLIALGRKKDESENAWAFNTKEKTNEPAVAPQQKEKIKISYPEGVFKINDTRVVFVSKGTSFLSVAYEYNVPLKRLFEFNEMQQEEIASRDQLIFIQRKRKTGTDEFYTVTSGESLHEIAQKQGIRFESLLEYNFLGADANIQDGEVLYLRKQAPAKPKLAAATVFISAVSKSNDFARASAIDADEYIVHTVQPKETLYSITKKYAVNKDDVLKWNDLQTTDLRTGQQLRIKRM